VVGEGLVEPLGMGLMAQAGVAVVLEDVKGAGREG